MGSYEGTEGWIWALNSPGTYSEDYPWPMFHHDTQNTGLYVPRAGAAFPAFLLIYMLLLMMKQSQQMSSLILLAAVVAVAAVAAVFIVFWWPKMRRT